MLIKKANQIAEEVAQVKAELIAAIKAKMPPAQKVQI